MVKLLLLLLLLRGVEGDGAVGETTGWTERAVEGVIFALHSWHWCSSIAGYEVPLEIQWIQLSA